MGHPQTESDIRARLDIIDAQIELLISDWEKLVDYSVGDRTVNKSQALQLLQSEGNQLLERLALIPVEEINIYDDPNM